MRRSLWDVAARVPHPTLLLWGTSDTTPYMAEGIARLDELMPRAEVRAFEGAPHSLATENTSELGAAVLEFLTRPSRRRRSGSRAEDGCRAEGACRAKGARGHFPTRDRAASVT